MLKHILFFISIFFSICVNAQTDSLFFEQGLGSSANRYTLDNSIYKLGRVWLYNYKVIKGKDTLALLIVPKEIEEMGYTFSISEGVLVKKDTLTIEAKNNKLLNRIQLSVIEGLSMNQGQTNIVFDYLNVSGNKIGFAREGTGLIENQVNVWLHPFRLGYFKILETCPFPYIRTPYQVGNKWNWKMSVGENWGDERWVKWQGSIDISYQYEIVKIEKVKTVFGEIDCCVVEAIAESSIGKTKLISYFHEKYGFVKYEFHAIDGTIILMEVTESYEKTSSK